MYHTQNPQVTLVEQVLQNCTVVFKDKVVMLFKMNGATITTMEFLYEDTEKSIAQIYFEGVWPDAYLAAPMLEGWEQDNLIPYLLNYANHDSAIGVKGFLLYVIDWLECSELQVSARKVLESDAKDVEPENDAN